MHSIEQLKKGMATKESKLRKRCYRVIFLLGFVCCFLMGVISAVRSVKADAINRDFKKLSDLERGDYDWKLEPSIKYDPCPVIDLTSFNR